MNKRRSTCLCLFSAAVLLSITLFQSCVEENIEGKFLSNSEEAESYYLTKAFPILDNKCFSCHNYHNSSNNKYDTYAKASAMAKDIANRTASVNPNTIMPPSTAAPLSEEEKQVIKQFYQLVKGDQLAAEEGGYSVSISWTALKFADSLHRVGVSGTFDKVYISYVHKDTGDIYEFLTDAEIMINTNSVNIGEDPMKSNNVRNHFFSYFTPVIYGQVMEMDAPSKKAKVKFTMNGMSQNVQFEIEEINENLVFTGSIMDIGNFKSQAALMALQSACGELHQDKVWSDISLKAEIKNYKKFPQP